MGWWFGIPSLSEFSLAPGDIFLYDIASATITNVSALLDPNNIYDDYSFRFYGQQIFWLQEDFQLGGSVNYLYDLATGSIYRYYTPEDDEDCPIWKTWQPVQSTQNQKA